MSDHLSGEPIPTPLAPSAAPPVAHSATQTGARSAAETTTQRVRLDICYDGTAFSGWAVQPEQRTVAGVLGDALATLFRVRVPMVVAGRTDTGVHAAGQVAHIDVDPLALARLIPQQLSRVRPAQAADSDLALVGLRRRLAGLLPRDVRVPAVSMVPVGFNARFSALRRHYRYRIASSEWGVSPLQGADVLAQRRALDANAMQEAASLLVGLHDFAAFCKPRDGATTIRDLQQLLVQSEPLTNGDGAVTNIFVTADAFCHSMVRSVVGALMAVGEGRCASTRPAELLATRQRPSDIAVAPAQGLTLVGVDYPPDHELADRAETTRAVRSAPDECDCPGDPR